MFDRITYIVPTTDKENKPLFKAEIAEHRQNIESLLGTIGGGWTVTEAKGGWIGEFGFSIEEDVFVYTCAVRNGLSDLQLDQLVAFAGKMAFIYNQEAVYLEVQQCEGFVRFVEPDPDFD